jgi:osmotically inducible lipoprotein OsmB
MRILKLSAALAAITALSGCLDSDVERGVVGAGAGVLVAEAVDGDPLVGGVIGAGAGVFCDDVGVCR